MATPTRQRVPAAERRDALIEAAVEEFAQGGFHATPVERVARRVGVAQPYVFSLFPTKRDLFIAAVERCFARVEEHFTSAPDLRVATIGDRYIELLDSERNLLTLQLHAYAAACEDDEIAGRVRAAYARLGQAIAETTGASGDQVAELVSHGLWLNVQAAMGVGDLEAASGWMRRVRIA